MNSRELRIPGIVTGSISAEEGESLILEGLTIKDGLVDNTDITINATDIYGFPNLDDSTYSFAGTTFTIEPAVTSFTVYEAGYPQIKTETENIEITFAGAGIYTIYYSAGVLTYATGDITRDHAIIASLYYSGTSVIFIEDRRYTSYITSGTKSYIATTDGTKCANGLTLTDFNTIVTTDAGAQFTSASGTILVAGTEIAIPSVDIPTTGISLYFKEGTSSAWNWARTTGNSFAIRADSLAQYNSVVGDTWSLTEADDGYFVLAHIFATSSQDDPVVGIVAQNMYSSAREASSSALTELRNIAQDGLPFIEYRVIGCIIFQTSAAIANTVHSRVIQYNSVNYIDMRYAIFASLGDNIVDHTRIAGLTSDTHPQYALLAGRTGDTLNIETITGVDSGTITLTAGTTGIINAGIGLVFRPSAQYDTASWVLTVTPTVPSALTNLIPSNGDTIIVSDSVDNLPRFLTRTGASAFHLSAAI